MSNESTKYRIDKDKDSVEVKPPSYLRVIIGMTDEEIEWELQTKKGDAGFMKAVRSEKTRRTRRKNAT